MSSGKCPGLKWKKLSEFVSEHEVFKCRAAAAAISPACLRARVQYPLPVIRSSPANQDLTLYPGGAAFGEGFDLIQAYHGGIARGGGQ